MARVAGNSHAKINFDEVRLSVLNPIRQITRSNDFFAISLLVVAIYLVGIPLQVSLITTCFLVIVILWQSAIGLSIWVRTFRPKQLEVADILGPGLATGVAFTALSWFLLCRVPWMAAQIFSVLTFPIAFDGIRFIKLKFQESQDKRVPTLAAAVAIIGLGYHRVGLLVLGLGLLWVFTTKLVRQADQSSLKNYKRFKSVPAQVAYLALVVFAFVIQIGLSNQNQTGFVPDSDTNFGEAIALGLTSNNSSLTPFTPDFRYHWLSHGWLGVILRSFNLEPFVGPNVLVPSLVITSSVFIVFSAIARWRSSNTFAATLTALLLVAGSSSTDQLVIGNDASTSNQIGTLFLLLAGYYIFSFLNDEISNHVICLGSCLLGFLLMGTKGPLVIVLCFALASHVAFTMFSHGNLRRSFKVSLCVTAGAVLAYFFVVASSEANTGIKYSNEISNISDLIWFSILIITLYLTRVPHLIAPIYSPKDQANRFLAIGAAVAGVLSFFAKTEGVVIVYFLTGAISLSLLFSSLSTNLSVTTPRQISRLFLSVYLFTFLLFALLNFTKIFNEMIPTSSTASRISPLAIQNLQFALFVAAASLLGVSRWITRLKVSKIWVVLILLISASTFGMFSTQSFANQIRQFAIDINGMNGGPPDSSLLAKSVIQSASWIRANSQYYEVVATNYLRENNGEIINLVSVSTQRSVLFESQYSRVPPMFVKRSEAKRKATIAFSNKPDTETANALIEQGVVWYLFSTVNSVISPRELCDANSTWRCEFQNDHSVVIRFIRKINK